MTFKTVVLKDLKPNPMRDQRVDPIDSDRVGVLKESVDVFGFRSGGIVARRNGDGEIEIASGHTRVAGAIKAGLKEATIEVIPLTDNEMARWYAQENFTQRGQSATAGIGSVIAAVRLIAPPIMRGDLDGLNALMPLTNKIDSENSFDRLRSNITNDRGVGLEILVNFFAGVENLKISEIREYLKIAKATGAYDRTIGEIAEQVENEDAEAEAQRVREEREAEAAAKRAGKKPVKTKAKKTTPTSVARSAKGSAKPSKLGDEVTRLFDNKNQVSVFYDVVEDIGTEVLPVENHAALVHELYKAAKEEDREMSGTFIREHLHWMLHNDKIIARRVAAQEKREVLRRNVKLHMKEALHCIFRDAQRMILQGAKLKQMIDNNPDVPVHVTPGQIHDAEQAIKFLQVIVDIAKSNGVDPRDKKTVVRLVSKN